MIDVPVGALPVTIWTTASGRNRTFLSFVESMEDAGKILRHYPMPPFVTVIHCDRVR